MQENMKTIPESAEGMEYPRRTFPEIDQPESPYILRLREGPQAALFRADDQAWRVEAIASIGAWLQDRLQAAPGCVVIA